MPYESTAASAENVECLVEYQQEQRRSRRFVLKQAAVVRHHDGVSHPLNAETCNASLYGVLLSAPVGIPGASEVEVELRLCKEGMQGVWLRGEGRVVRSEIGQTGGFRIAVAFDQPLTERPHPAAAPTRPEDE
jgi:PilZ domain